MTTKGKTSTGDAPAPSSEPDVAAPDAADTAATTGSSTTPPAGEADESPTVEDASEQSDAGAPPTTLSEAWAAKRDEVPEGEIRDFMDQFVAELGDKREDETDAEYDERAQQYLAAREWELDEAGMPRRIPVAGDAVDPGEDVCVHGFTRGFKCPSGCWSL